MYLEKVLNHPNVVGIVMIALLFCAGFVYAFAFDGFQVETVSSAEVEAWLAQAGGGDYGGDDPEPPDCDCSNNKELSECSCESQVFKRTKTDKQGSWKNPCNGTILWPCPRSNECRNSHSGSGNSDCSCDPHPSGGRGLWSVCKATGKEQCDGKKGSCKR